MVVRGKKRKGVKYYGPFAHAYAIRDTLDLLIRVFPIRTSRPGVFERAGRSGRPCLRTDIGRGSGPCVGAVPPEEYRKHGEDFCAFMDGAHEAVIRRLQAEMAAAAEALEFEKAARIRDQLAAVGRVIEREQMVTERPEDLDVIAFSGDELEASFQVFFVRGGRMTGRKGFIVDKVEDLEPPELLASFLENLYGDPEGPTGTDVPREILVPVQPANEEVMREWLALLRRTQGALRVPQRGADRKLLATAADDARESC